MDFSPEPMVNRLDAHTVSRPFSPLGRRKDAWLPGQADYLYSSGLLSALSPDLQAVALRHFRPLPFQDGEILIQKDGKDRHLLVILDGRVEVWLRQGERRVRVSEVQTGEPLGEVAFFDESTPRTADVIAAGRGMAAILTQENWAALRRESPEVAAHIERVVVLTLASRVRRIMGRVRSKVE